MEILNPSLLTAPLAVNGLVKRYGELTAVDGVSFAVPRGTCYGLLGPNGAGKTTTMRCCLGLTAPDAGTIDLLGEPIPRRAREARQGVGIVPQFDSLDPDFTVGENLVVYGRYFGFDDASVRAKVPDLLEFAGLTGKAREPLRALSGGMKRRLMLARALVNDPDILFLDEPTTGLDPQARHLIWDRLKKLTAQGKTVVLTTHFMDEAERLCHRLAVIDHGRMVTEGAPRQLIAAEIEPQVVEVYGDSSEVVQRLADARAKHAGRVEVSGETAFFYCREVAPLIAVLACRDDLRYIHRPANLEDVFLKLTGRELRD
ncbi:MAG TPA: ATP-binding cassette domain-containing protein [Rhodocyclaceae bacterium]|nr:ATP-binding cassette domain-containing protein [Rhodocyclaceae bacterium]